MAYFFLLIYLFFIYIRPQEMGGLLYRFNIPWMEVIAAIICVTWFLSASKAPDKVKIPPAPQNRYAVGFLIALTLSQVTNFSLQMALLGFIELFKNIVLYFFIAGILNSKKKLNGFIYVWVGLTCYVAIQTIILFRTGVGVGGTQMVAGRVKYIGTLSDPNDVALAFVVIIPFLVLGFIGKGRLLIIRIVSLLFLIVIMTGLYLTNSRGGMVSFGAVLFYLFYVQSKRKVPAIILGSCLLAGIYLVAPSRVAEINVSENSAHGRIVGMGRGFVLLRAGIKNYIFGAGYGSFQKEYGFVAHNTMMHVAGETGSLGLFCFLGMLYYSIRSVIQIYAQKSESEFKWVIIGLGGAFIGFIIATIFLSRAYSELVYILVGLSVALNRVGLPEVSVNGRIQSWIGVRNIFVIEMGVLIISYITVRLYF